MSHPHGRRLFAPAALLLLLFAAQPAARAQAAGDAQLAREMDELVSKAYPANHPGAAVIVVRGGKTVLRKGYGMADMELGVPVAPDMVFRLGSITKQFTAVATLMLAERGKLSLSDDLTKFLPDYPTKGKAITVEHLLTHTSGIKSYTSLPSWLPLWRKDMTVAELIDLFKNEPTDFEPGERWAYNNSGYVLLGAIIEKASGQTYEEFLERNVFEPLGMKGTYYGSATRLIPRRVPGYSRGPAGFENAQYISMTQPYAAGSLLSTVDDLALWDAALYTEKLVRQSSLQKAFTPYTLKDGTQTGYGYGWQRASYEGRTVIEHGGGIHGFSTSALRLPEDRVFVAVLTNRDFDTPDSLAFKLAALAVGRPVRTAVAVALRPEEMDAVAGVYRINEKETYSVRRAAGKLTIRRNAGRQAEVFPLSPTEFFYEAESPDRLIFTKDAAGKVTGLRVSRRVGPPTVAARTDRPVEAAEERTAIRLAPEVLERYVGVYEIAPAFSITVTRRGGQLFGLPTGQAEVELFPESETKFFLKVVDAQLEFQRDAAGKITGLVLHQGGQVVPAKKTK